MNVKTLGSMLAAGLLLAGCGNAYKEEGMCTYMGTCKDDCFFRGDCGEAQVIKDPEPLLPSYQLLP